MRYDPSRDEDDTLFLLLTISGVLVAGVAVYALIAWVFGKP